MEGKRPDFTCTGAAKIFSVDTAKFLQWLRMFENQAIQDIWLKVLAKIIIIVLADSVELAAEI